MVKTTLSVAALSLALSGCATGPQTADTPPASLAASAVTQVDFEETITPELVQPPALVEAETAGPSTVPPKKMPSAGGLSLAALEDMALANNPAVTQSEALVRALRGKWVQVGLPPNPTVGYVAGEVGNEGAAGQQGGFVGQEFITASKLQRNRDVVAAEVGRAEQELAAKQQKVRTDVAKAYYAALLAQRRVELTEELVRISGEAVEASESLVSAEEIPLAGLLQTKVQQKNAQVLARTAQNELAQSWRELSSVVGGVELPVQPLVGDIERLPDSLNWDNQLQRLQSQSPEVAVAMAELERSRRALGRASVEAVPDIDTQLSVQHDDSTGDTIVGVQVSVPIPLWDRNQGGIRQAQAEVTGAKQNVERVRLSLNKRLASVFRDYSDAAVTAENYSTEILPLAGRTFELVQKGYKQGEVGYLDLLAAQQTFSQTNLSYLDALGSLWASYLQIDGLLLDGSLE